MGTKPIISIVGRPNVGKSTLFNRLVGYRKAITEDTPGVTRDRNYGEFEYDGYYFVLVDTGGFEPAKEEGFFPLMKQQIITSLEESSMVIFVLDGKEGLLPQDREISAGLRKYGKAVFHVVNKVDSRQREWTTAEFYALGVQKFYPVSSLHGLGIEDLLEDIVTQGKQLPGNCRGQIGGQTTGDQQPRRIRSTRKPRAEEQEYEEAVEAPAESRIRVAIVGRPNTGKSSITNRLLGADRMIVSEIPGTTRDAIDSKIVFRDKEIILVDTAGLRRKSRIEMKVEGYSVSSALRTIEQADVVNLVIDADEGVSHQDGGIAHVIITRGKGLCLVINKWDLVEGKISRDEYRKLVKEKIPHTGFAPLIFASAKTGKNLFSILDADLRIYNQLKRRIKTASLNKTFHEFFQKQGLSYQQGKQVSILYVNQAKTEPPTFILFANYPELIHEHYKRYLENSIREKYGFLGAPIRLVFKKK
ncbi:MAG TPA: ribosome biogenesis GTPase Der [Syntrophorhabdus aromaticivorans]|nr:ribosome biogenesis GTPase Der [Syntrophorhabdus aromaticivorans]